MDFGTTTDVPIRVREAGGSLFPGISIGCGAPMTGEMYARMPLSFPIDGVAIGASQALAARPNHRAPP